MAEVTMYRVRDRFYTPDGQMSEQFKSINAAKRASRTYQRGGGVLRTAETAPKQAQ